MDARPDQEEMEAAMNKFLVQLEWAFSDTMSVCWQSWKAFQTQQATNTLLTLMSCVIATCDSNCGLQEWNPLPHATGHAQQQRDAYSDFGEIYPMLSWVIPCYHKLSHFAQSTNRNLSGYVKLDLDLLKPWRVSAAAAARDDDASPPVKHMSQQQQSQVWLEYA